MKKFLLLTLLAFTLITSPVLAEFKSDLIITSPNGIWTDSRAYTTLNDAVAAVGVNERTIKIVSPQTVTDLTVPLTVTLEFERDGSIANSGQLTINTKNIIAPNRQIFTGVGNIDFATGSTLKTGWFSNIETAFALTSNDEVTLIVSKPQSITANFSPGNDVHLKWEDPGNILTVNAGVEVGNLKNIKAGNYQIFAGAGDFDFLDGTQLNLSWFNHIRSVITWVENEKVTLVVSESSTVSYTDSTDPNMTIEVLNGGMLSIDAGRTLTINGLFKCGPLQAFSGSGSVAFGTLVHEILPEWMGDIDGTADDVQINAAITAASNNQIIKCYAPTYTCSSSIAMNKSCTLSLGQTAIISTANPVIQITADDVTITGINSKESKLINSTTLETIIRSVGATRIGITIRNLYFEGASTVYVAQVRESEQLIHLGDEPNVGVHSDVLIKNCYFTKCLHGILFQYVDDSKVINNTFNYDHAGNVHLNLWGCDRVKIIGNNFYDSSVGNSNAIEVLGASNDNSSNIIISDNTFYGDYLETITLAAKKSQIIGNNVYSNAGANHQGIQVFQPAGHTQLECYENIVSNNYIYMANAASVSAISLKDAGDNYGVKRCIVSNNIIYNNGASVAIGFSGQNISDNIISSNIINDQGNGFDGINISGATCIGNILRGNWISGSGRNGIWLSSTGSTTVDGNEITGSGQAGIYITAGGDHIVINNRTHSNTTYGILFQTAPIVKRFFGNLAYSNTTADISTGSGIVNREVLTGIVTLDNAFESGDIDSSGGAVTGTLGSGLYMGQVKTIVMTDATTSSTISVTNHRVSDPEVGTFDAVDETWTLVWTGTEWDTLGTPTCTFL